MVIYTYHLQRGFEDDTLAIRVNWVDQYYYWRNSPSHQHQGSRAPLLHQISPKCHYRKILKQSKFTTDRFPLY